MKLEQLIKRYPLTEYQIFTKEGISAFLNDLSKAVDGKQLLRAKEDLISLQKEIIEVKQKEILDSIHYAKRIQTTLLPSNKYIERHLDKLAQK